MLKKICSKCGVKKPITGFYNQKRGKYGVMAICKLCANIRVANWWKHNPEKLKLKNSTWYIRNRQSAIITSTLWRKNNPDAVRLIAQRFRNKIRDTVDGRLYANFSRGVALSLRGNKFNQQWETQVNYTLDDIKTDFKFKYYNGMTQDSLRQKRLINIHHIILQSLFQFKIAKDSGFQRCWALNNLYPLWKEDHIALHSRLDPELKELMLTNPTEEQIENLCRKHLKYTLEHSIHVIQDEIKKLAS